MEIIFVHQGCDPELSREAAQATQVVVYESGPLGSILKGEGVELLAYLVYYTDLTRRKTGGQINLIDLLRLSLFKLWRKL